MNNKIILKLNNEEKIVIELLDSLNELHCCYSSRIIYIQGSHEYILALDSLGYLLDILKFLLIKALDNKLHLHESITLDIGYLWNEKLQDRPGLAYKKDKEGIKRWVGEAHSLWNYDPDSWIYNDLDGNIILELTPHYLWHFRTPKEGEDFVSYDVWIKNYKPLLIRKISVDVALKWLVQIDIFLKKIEENNKIVFGSK